ncbi:MAG: TetR/AcrR family transcriptional regulator [Pirellulales bacterium]
MAQATYQASEKRAVQILLAARELFLADGWDHFSVERIAEFMECSRPLVYKHFSCKEEILLALAIESKRRRARFYERAVMFPGRPREKILAIGEVETFLSPRDLPVELLVASTCLRAKTSRERQGELKVLDVRAISLGAGIIREAVNAGDLKLPGRMCPEDLLFFMWASRWGASTIMRSDTPIAMAGVAEPALAVEWSLGLLLDGYGWQPLSSQWDYKRTRKRVHAEAFPPEVVEEILGNRRRIESHVRETKPSFQE